MREDLNVVAVVDESPPGKRERFFLSLMPVAAAFKRGLIPQAIVGELKQRPEEGQPITPDIFVANTVFKDFLHSIVATFSSEPGIVSEAKRIGKGIVAIIDKRVPDPNAAIAPPDILGVFTVENGEVTSYVRNPKHVLLNQHGFSKLEPHMRAKLMNELQRLGT